MKKTINETIKALEERKDRSAWEKGVHGYRIPLNECIKVYN